MTSPAIAPTPGPLSARQVRILDFLQAFIPSRGYPPTLRDIQGGCDVSSVSVVSYNLNVLEQRGLIRRTADLARGIEVLAGPGSYNPYRPVVPVVGALTARLAPPGAASPVPHDQEWVELTPRQVQRRRDAYAVRVDGESLAADLLADGDLVVLAPETAVRPGPQFVLWLTDRSETVLRRAQSEHGLVRLDSDHPDVPPVRLPESAVDVRGRVLSRVRIEHPVK